MRLSEMLMKLIAQIFILMANYLVSKLIIFRKKDDGEKGTAEK